MTHALKSVSKVDEVHENVNEKIDAHKASERNKTKTA